MKKKSMRGSARTERPASLPPLELVMVCHGGPQIEGEESTFYVPSNMTIIFYVRDGHGAVSRMETPIEVCSGAIASQDFYETDSECPNYELYMGQHHDQIDGIFNCAALPYDFNMANFPASIYNFENDTLSNVATQLRQYYGIRPINLRCFFCRSNDDEDLDDTGDGLDFQGQDFGDFEGFDGADLDFDMSGMHDGGKKSKQKRKLNVNVCQNKYKDKIDL